MKNIIIIGAGGLAIEVVDIINSCHEYNIVGYSSLEPSNLDIFSNYNFYNEDDLICKFNKGVNIVVAIGDPSTRKKVVDKLLPLGFSFPNIVHSTSYISPFIVNDLNNKQGIIIGPNCTIEPYVNLGNFCCLTANCFIGHYSKLGNFCFLGPSSTICGDVSIGSLVYIGAGATIIHRKLVSDNVKIAAGAVVMTNLHKVATYIGNPAKIFKV